MNHEKCPFCFETHEKQFYEGKMVRGIWDSFPVSPGHALLIPKRHVPTWFDASAEEQAELLEAVSIVRQIIEETYAPDGYNVGINIGSAAGQTVFHLHIHVIPRFRGDVPDPRGGVRYVIPSKANYIAARPMQKSSKQLPHDRALIAGNDDPLLPHILTLLDGAVAVDIVVAFVMESGVRQIIEHLRDLLDRGGKLRLLTGDYLDVTDPQALLPFLDLEGKKELRVFETADISFHPKTYIFYEPGGSGVAYVGSSNLSAMAMGAGIEWNYKVVSSWDNAGFRSVADAFESIFTHRSTRPLDYNWITEYSIRRTKTTTRTIDVAPEEPEPVPEPHSIQVEALQALKATREAGNSAGLVVLATGLGKTWLAAFDSARSGYERILFVAHREEILSQAMATFRRIRPLSSLGNFSGTEKIPDADIVFASIQTLGRKKHLLTFDPETFDYIIIDEFHHAAAKTYRNLIDHFSPQFLLGLTATPERTDGGDLLSLCQNNVVYRCDLGDGIERKLLSTFRYFGIPDEIDYTNIPWRSRRFDEEALTTAAATESRARNALEQFRSKGGTKALGFCCSKTHAEYMANYFNLQGLRAVAVHSGPSSAPRAASLENLEQGKLDIIFAVDMFNEGIDLPEIDTIMMLRPTESRILWLQQFGRGLRKKLNEKHLTVIDYIGNHRIFLLKPMALLGLGQKDSDIAYALEALQRGNYELPQGCEVTYDLKAINILKSLLRHNQAQEAIRAYYEDFRDREGMRPTASEAFSDGYSPRNTRTTHGSWLRFVGSMGDLSSVQQELLKQHGAFLDMLESTHMTKSYKMVTILAMLASNRFPGSISIDALTAEFIKVVKRSTGLKADIGINYTDVSRVRNLLIKNPIDAWTGEPHFSFDAQRFTCSIRLAENERDDFQEMVREIVDWRLAEYLQRDSSQNTEAETGNPDSIQLTLWKPYMREKIPVLFGLPFSEAVWNVGFVAKDNHLFLLVTLETKGFTDNFKYTDHFLSPDQFQWQSQNRTKQNSTIGQKISKQKENGTAVHLFIRATKKVGTTAAPFYYCGDVDFIDWEGDAPITVRWQLPNPVPISLWSTLGIQ